MALVDNIGDSDVRLSEAMAGDYVALLKETLELLHK